jgi:hypothetical protein
VQAGEVIFHPQDFQRVTLLGHFYIGQLAVTELDVDVITDLAVSGEIGRGLVGGDGKDLKLPPQNGGEKAVEGLPGVGGIPGKDGLKDVVVADIGDVWCFIFLAVFSFFLKSVTVRVVRG